MDLTGNQCPLAQQAIALTMVSRAVCVVDCYLEEILGRATKRKSLNSSDAKDILLETKKSSSFNFTEVESLLSQKMNVFLSRKLLGGSYKLFFI